jgi:hypothetical protein
MPMESALACSQWYPNTTDARKLNRKTSQVTFRSNCHTRWNYTLIMLEAVLQNRITLQAFIKDDIELQHFQFGPDRWKRLKQIRNLLKPFKEHTKFVSHQEPTLHRILNLYLQLEKLLKSIINKEGVYSIYDLLLL